MTTSTCSSMALLARAFLAPIFLFSGLMKITHWSETAAQMQSEGMVMVPFFLAAAIAVEIVGGLMILLGWKARFGALTLFFFLIPVTLIFHDFWKYTGAEQQNQMQHFAKNLTIMGGLAMLAAAGAGRYALDACCAMTACRVRQEVEVVDRIPVTSGAE